MDIAMKHAGTFVLVATVIMVCAGSLWAQDVNTPPAPEQQPAAKAEAEEGDGVTLETVTSFLDKMGYVYKVDKSVKVPQIEMRMRGSSGNYDMLMFIDNPRKIVYLCVNRFMTIPDTHPRKSVLLQRLMEWNWDLLIGKYEWDKTDGEVRLSYTFSTENGLGYEAFAACFQLLVLIADRDYPKLMKLMWAEETPPTAAATPPSSVPGETPKVKPADTTPPSETQAVQ